MEDRDAALEGQASKGRALVHSPSGKGSNSLDQIVPKPSQPKHADPNGDVSLSEGSDPSSAGTDKQSAGRTESPRGRAKSTDLEYVSLSKGGMTNDSSQACSSIHLAQGGEASAMAQLADAAAAMCSQEKALQAQKASPAGMT